MSVPGNREGASAEAGDDDLVGRIRAGDRRAETELVGRFSRSLSIVLRRTGAGAPAVEDLHQETFRLALAKIRAGALRNPASLPGFLAGLARNLALAHFRRFRSALRATGLAEAGELPSRAPGALEVLLEREQADVVRRVLGSMGSRRDREMLERFYVGGEDKRDICVDLGLSSLQFNRALSRARLRYRALYERALERPPRCDRPHPPVPQMRRSTHFSPGTRRP